MQKGELTYQAIIEQAAKVFSKQGYAGTSMGDLMKITGLSKGAIYNHFESKDDLAVHVFDYSIGLVNDAMSEAVRNAPRNAVDRLIAVVAMYRNYLDMAIFAGGCPMLNTSVEADDTHPALRDRAQQAMDGWRQFYMKEIQRGIVEGQLKADIDPDVVTDVVISGIEGGVMMTKLYGDSKYMNRVVDHLVEYIKSFAT